MGFDQEAAAVMMSRIAVFRYVFSGIFFFYRKDEGEIEKHSYLQPLQDY